MKNTDRGSLGWRWWTSWQAGSCPTTTWTPCSWLSKTPLSRCCHWAQSELWRWFGEDSFIMLMGAVIMISMSYNYKEILWKHSKLFFLGWGDGGSIIFGKCHFWDNVNGSAQPQNHWNASSWSVKTWCWLLCMFYVYCWFYIYKVNIEILLINGFLVYPSTTCMWKVYKPINTSPIYTLPCGKI